MSTPTRRSAAELDALIAKLPQAAPMTCQQLCDELNNDFDILQNPEDFPGNIAQRFSPQRTATSSPSTPAGTSKTAHPAPDPAPGAPCPDSRTWVERT